MFVTLHCFLSGRPNTTTLLRYLKRILQCSTYCSRCRYGVEVEEYKKCIELSKAKKVIHLNASPEEGTQLLLFLIH